MICKSSNWLIKVWNCCIKTIKYTFPENIDSPQHKKTKNIIQNIFNENIIIFTCFDRQVSTDWPPRENTRFFSHVHLFIYTFPLSSSSACYTQHQHDLLDRKMYYANGHSRNMITRSRKAESPGFENERCFFFYTALVKVGLNYVYGRRSNRHVDFQKIIK